MDAPAVDENRVVLLMSEDPYSYHVIRIGGRWKVWAEPSIGVRKAAEAEGQQHRANP